jgi:hypothetical protein
LTFTIPRWTPDQQRTAKALRSIRGTAVAFTAPQQRIFWTQQPFNRQIVAVAEEGVRFACTRSPPMWILLLLPFIGLLWVPFYNFQDPALFGFPFFYWYQLVWVPISSLLIWLVYRRRTPDEAP